MDSLVELDLLQQSGYQPAQCVCVIVHRGLSWAMACRKIIGEMQIVYNVFAITWWHAWWNERSIIRLWILMIFASRRENADYLIVSHLLFFYRSGGDFTGVITMITFDKYSKLVMLVMIAYYWSWPIILMFDGESGQKPLNYPGKSPVTCPLNQSIVYQCLS